jgi:hypothetical protein
MVEKKHFDQVYRDNDRLTAELKNMYMIQEENKDLREDLERLKSLTYEDRMKEMHEDNFQIRKRNGQLLIQLTEAQTKIEEL